MADIQIDTFNGNGNVDEVIGPIWTSPDVGYIVYASFTSANLVYRKTTDGGQTWGAAVTVRTGAHNCRAVWFDKWTPGGTGAIIHICWNVTADSTFQYRQLDTSTDTLGTIRTLSGMTGALGYGSASIIKARNGNLYACCFLGTATNPVFVRSTDGGTTWTSRTAPTDANQNQSARIWLAPGNEAGTEDVWLIQHLNLTTTLVLKLYDDSANSWSTTTISTGIAMNQHQHLSVATRLSDNHAIVAAFDAAWNASGNIKVWDIGGTGSITAKTSVITSTANVLGVGVQVVEKPAAIYVSYSLGSGGTPQTNTTCYYKKSTDGGGTWGTQTQYQAAAGSYYGRNCFVSGSVGRIGGRFEVVWWHNNSPTLVAIFTNYDNSVRIDPWPGGGGPVAQQIKELLMV